MGDIQFDEDTKGINSKPKEDEEQEADNVEKSFDNKAKAEGDSNNPKSKPVNYKIGNEVKDAVKQEIKNPAVITNEQRQEIRDDRIAKEEHRKRHDFAVSNITDEVYNKYENKLWKDKDFNNKASLFGANGWRRGFTRHSRRVRQESNTLEAPPRMKVKEVQFQLNGRYKLQKAMNELAQEENYIQENMKIEIPNKDRTFRDKYAVDDRGKKGGLDFSVVMENDVRHTYGLLSGNRRSKVDGYVKKAISDYDYNSVHNAGSRAFGAGRFQGGFDRRNLVDKAQSNDKRNDDEYEFTVKTEDRVGRDLYYYDYGNKKSADAIIDKQEPEANRFDDSKLISSNI